MKTLLLICSNPTKTAEMCLNESEADEIVRSSLGIILGCTGLFGIVLGSARNFSQALASGVKLPLAWVITLAVCAPAFYGLAAVFGRGIRLRALITLILAAAARASLVLFALLPVLWLAVDLFGGNGSGYHRLTMSAALIYGCAGVAGLGIMWRALGVSLKTVPLLLGFLGTFCLVAGQTAWSLRPFVGRPSETTTPWFRAPESTFLEAISTGSDSAREIYRETESIRRERCESSDSCEEY
jgi:hypothetical protein